MDLELWEKVKKDKKLTIKQIAEIYLRIALCLTLKFHYFDTFFDIFYKFFYAKVVKWHKKKTTFKRKNA